MSDTPSGDNGAITSPETPVKYPEQSPNRKDKPIFIDVKPEKVN